ncbi:GNAT family N-acetyltransferase [Longibacter sp.]|uniref:GNAT family N-acetyltransferase n=1 Tax=Longibacter sp. TaxID=2045415 RepID=UPI003EC0B7BA
MIHVRAHRPHEATAIEHLFRSVFSASEGAAEGRRIGTLVQNLTATLPADDVLGFVAAGQDVIVGAILFSRLQYPEDVDVFMLSPVAVHPDRQGEGVGQRLITAGLQALKERGIAVVVTYGDPSFYAKVGFQPASPDTLPPPLVLSQPEGWLAQSLTSDDLPSLSRPARCVDAFNDPVYW